MENKINREQVSLPPLYGESEVHRYEDERILSYLGIWENAHLYMQTDTETLKKQMEPALLSHSCGLLDAKAFPDKGVAYTVVYLPNDEGCDEFNLTAELANGASLNGAPIRFRLSVVGKGQDSRTANSNALKYLSLFLTNVLLDQGVTA